MEPNQNPNSELPVYLVYCDESGTTGPNYFDPASPLFVYAMVAVRSSELDGLDATIQTLINQHLRSPPSELKYSKLARGERNLSLVADIGRALDRVESRIVYAVVEKRFNVCALVVETFLDPTFNPMAPSQDAGPLRKEFANIIYDTVDDSVLETFADSLRKADQDAAREAGRRIASRLRFHYADEVQTLAEAIVLGLREFFWLPAEVPGEPKRSNVPNPLVHSFQPTLHHLNSMLVDINATAQLVADGDSHFGSVLDRSFEIGTGKSEISPEVLREFGELHFDRISSYRREDSGSNIMIQCADLAAGIARQVSTARSSSSLLSGRVVEAWRPYSRCGERAKAGFPMVSRRYEQMSLLGPV